MPDANLSDPAVLAFVLIPALLATALACSVWLAWRRAGEPSHRAWRAAAITLVATATWMATTWQVAGSGALRRFDATPPPLALLVVALTLIAVRLAFSTTGKRLACHIPLWALVGAQAFRYPLELSMHRMYERGLMPVQMSYSGLNFDIVTGITAVLVAGLLATGRAGWRIALAWNVVGSILLVNIVVIAVLSTPIFRFFGDDRLNVFVTYPPFVWLPAVMVAAALAGHLIVFRAIWAERR